MRVTASRDCGDGGLRPDRGPGCGGQKSQRRGVGAGRRPVFEAGSEAYAETDSGFEEKEGFRVDRTGCSLADEHTQPCDFETPRRFGCVDGSPSET